MAYPTIAPLSRVFQNYQPVQEIFHPRIDAKEVYPLRFDTTSRIVSFMCNNMFFYIYDHGVYLLTNLDGSC